MRDIWKFLFEDLTTGDKLMLMLIGIMLSPIVAVIIGGVTGIIKP
jgi:hypothetical protein